jgi:hypothetical protein
MSTSINTSFVRQYERKVHLVFQREGAYLRDCTRYRPDVVGQSTTFQKLTAGTATTKARHGTITPMNQTHTAHECTLSDFYAGDWVDRLDEAKINIDERDAIATSGAYALGRKVDSQIETVLAAQNTNNVTITVTGIGNVRAGLLTMVANLFALNVPNDGQNYGALTPVMWARAMTIQEFSSSDWVGPTGLPFNEGIPTQGRMKDWMGFKWVMHTGLTGIGTATANSYVWHKSSMGYATGAHAGNVAARASIAADITWHGDRAAHFVNHMMSGGCVVIDANGIIEGQSNDTTAIAAS